MTDKSSRLKQLLPKLGTRGRQVLYAVLSYVLLLLLCLPAISPEQYDLKVGDVAPKTITASRDVEDTMTTLRRRQAAADAVAPVYYKDDNIAEQVMSDLDDIFGQMRAVREFGEQIRMTWTDNSGTYTDDHYEAAQGMLPAMTMTNYQLRTLMGTSEAEFEALYQSVSSATRTTLVSTITEGQINVAINNIQQIVSYNTRTDLWYNIAIPMLRVCLRPNMLIDQRATEENRQRAYDAVEATVYKQDQNIVVKGSRVSEEQLAVLDSLGMLSGNTFNLKLYTGAAGILLMIVATIWVYALLFERSVFNMGISSLVLLISGILTIALSLFIGRYVSAGAMPLMLAPILVVSLIGERPAHLVNLAVTMVMVFLTVQSHALRTTEYLSVLLIGLVGGTFTILILRRNASRLFVFLTALVVGMVDFVLLFCVAFLLSTNLTDSVINGAQAFIGAMTSTVLSLALQPILESLFNLVTPAKLVELSSPNQPLLRRLMMETPGTYHHAMVVANLAEAAAEAIDANALLVRVGAYYHDIGKLQRPMYFKENQMGENPHDRTDPRVSACILTEHTRDGAKLARSQHLPEEIVDMIRQHHGNTPVTFFYAKAVQMYGEEHVDLKDFRYDGPKPQTIEAAILMLADTCEAAVRSLQEPTCEKIHEMIAKVVRGKMEDGQLDECPLTFKDIGKICAAFEQCLQGVFHERIEYPTVDLEHARRLEAERAEQEQSK